MINKSRLDIEKAFDEAVRARRPNTATAKGSFIGDVIKLPLSNELSKMWFVMDWVEATRSVKRLLEVDADNDYKANLGIAMNLDGDGAQALVDTAVDNLATNYSLTRKTGDFAYAYVLFLRDTLNPGDSFTVAAGSIVSTLMINGILYQFSVVNAATMDGDRAAYYLSVATQYQSFLDDMSYTELYAMRVKVIATAVGSAYNVGSESIIKIVTAGDFTNILNTDAATGGLDEETNAELLDRCKRRYKGVAIGNAVAYMSNIIDNLNDVTDVLVVGAGHELMRRDLFASTLGNVHVGAKGDVYVLGKDPTQIMEVYNAVRAGYVGATPDDIVLLKQPVEDIISIIGPDSGAFTEDVDFRLIKDYGNYEGSVDAQDLVRWLKSTKTVVDEVITRGGVIGGADTPAVGLLDSITEVYDTPEVLSVTPVCNGTWTFLLDPYPYYPVTPLGCTPEFVGITRVENITQGDQYDLTGITWGTNILRNEVYLASTPNVSYAAPVYADVVQVDYTWKHGYLATTQYQRLNYMIDWSPDTAQQFTDAFGAFTQPFPAAEYFASYEAEAPLNTEALEITYEYDKKIEDAQAAIVPVQPLTDDILVKQGKEALLDVSLSVVSDSQYTDTELQTRVATAVSRYLSSKKLGNSVDQSDIITAIMAVDASFVGTTLNVVGGVDEQDTEIPVLATTGFASEGTIYIEGEQITYEDINSTAFLNCTRGANGTNAAAHANAVAVTYSKTGQAESSGTGVERITTLPLTKFARRVMGVVKVDNEYITYSGVTASTLTGLTRGYYSTTPALHYMGAAAIASTVISLVGSVTAADTTIPVVSTRDFPESGVVLIGTEQIAYTSLDGSNLLGCTRGYNTTIPATHEDGDAVTMTSILTVDISAAATSLTVTGTPNCAREISRMVLFCDANEYIRSGSVTLTIV